MGATFAKRGVWRSQAQTLSAGSASAPSLSFTGDTNTGIFSPAADTWSVAVGGVEELRVTTDGVNEVIGGVVYPVASQYDVGTAPNQIPLNQYLGTVAYQDAAALKVGRLMSTGAVGAWRETAVPAGGTAGTGVLLSSATNFGIFFGSGAPTLSAAKGSLYLRSDGTTTNDRAYINTDGGTTWTALTTAA